MNSSIRDDFHRRFVRLMMELNKNLKPREVS